MGLYGSNFAQLATNIPSGFANDWTINGTGCLYSNDNVFATSTIIAGGNTASLVASNFGFNIPANSGFSLLGIEAILHKNFTYDLPGDTVTDLLIQIVDSGGNLIGTNQANSGQWPTALTDVTYGGPSNTWGINTAGGLGQSLISSLINTSGFGVMIQGTANGGNQDTLQVDSVSLQITTSAGTSSINSSFPLFIAGLASGNANIPLFTTGSTPFSGGIPLYTYGLASGNSNIPLFLSVAAPISGNLPLYIDGGPHISKCYSALYPSIVNEIDIPNWILGSGSASAGSGYNVATTGNALANWSSTQNLKVEDGTLVNYFNASYTPSNWLVATNFNFSVPSTSTVKGILAQWKRKYDSAYDVVADQAIRIVRSGIIDLDINNDKSSAVNWSTDTLRWDNFGGTTDLWGQSWLPADINVSGFGVALSAKAVNGASMSPGVDACRIGVFYTTESGIASVQWSNLNNIYLSDNSRTTCSMTSGDAQSSQILSFFNISGISTQAQVSGVIFNFYKQQNVGDDSVIDRQVFLIRNGIVESGVNYAGGIWGTNEHNPVSYSINTDQNGNALQISDVTASGFGVLIQAGTNNFGAGTAQIDTVSCTLCATIPGITSSFPLFLNVSNSASGSLPLFIHGNTSFSGNLPLYIHGLNSFSGNIPLFINGLVSDSGNIPLYLQSNAFGSGSLPLFTAASVGDSGGITLYLQGQPTYPKNDSLPLYLGNFSSSGNLDSLRRSIPLYLDSHDFNGGITLYLGVSNIGTPNDSITLFTKGAAFNSAGSIPLFLNNSGLTNSLPLYVKGLSYGTNPYINTDGYYPFEGGMTLFLKGTPGASLPLYLRAEFGSISGNIPLFIEANPFESGGIPLYMNASVPLTQNMPLYHHGW